MQGTEAVEMEEYYDLMRLGGKLSSDIMQKIREIEISSKEASSGKHPEVPPEVAAGGFRVHMYLTKHSADREVFETEYFSAKSWGEIEWKPEGLRKAAIEKNAMLRTLKYVQLTAEQGVASEANTARSWVVLASKARNAQTAGYQDMRKKVQAVTRSLERKLAS